MFTICRKPWLFMKRHHFHGWTKLKLKPISGDSGGTRRFPVCLEDLNGGKRDWELGVFLGSEGYQRKNWEGAKKRSCTRLSKWKWLLPMMCHIREKFWSPITWLPRLDGKDLLHWNYQEAWGNLESHRDILLVWWGGLLWHYQGNALSGT